MDVIKKQIELSKYKDTIKIISKSFEESSTTLERNNKKCPPGYPYNPSDYLWRF